MRATEQKSSHQNWAGFHQTDTSLAEDRGGDVGSWQTGEWTGEPQGDAISSPARTMIGSKEHSGQFLKRVLLGKMAMENKLPLSRDTENAHSPVLHFWWPCALEKLLSMRICALGSKEALEACLSDADSSGSSSQQWTVDVPPGIVTRSNCSAVKINEARATA